MHNRYLELDIPKMELLTLYAVQRVCFLSSLQSKSKTVLMVDVGKKGNQLGNLGKRGCLLNLEQE